MSLSFRDLVSGLTAIRLISHVPLIAHVDLHSFGPIDGGADTLLQALLHLVDTLVMPVFTYRTMVIPSAGPENNGMVYNHRVAGYSHSEIFTAELPADLEMGEVAELLRRQDGAVRSSHPVLSFASLGVDAPVRAQTLADPLAPLRVLVELEACVLLAGTDQTRNFSLHLAERLAGRKSFTRWALTPDRIVELPGMPGCARGFNQVTPQLQQIIRQTTIGGATISVIPLQKLLNISTAMLQNDPAALLCSNPACLACQSVRQQAGLM